MQHSNVRLMDVVVTSQLLATFVVIRRSTQLLRNDNKLPSSKFFFFKKKGSRIAPEIKNNITLRGSPAPVYLSLISGADYFTCLNAQGRINGPDSSCKIVRNHFISFSFFIFFFSSIFFFFFLLFHLCLRCKTLIVSNPTYTFSPYKK